MIETFYNITASNIRRSTATPTSGDTITTVSSFLGVIRAVDDISKLYVENNIGKEYDLIADNGNDVRVGDDIYIDGSKYDVLGVTIYEDLLDGTDSYLNIRVAK